MVARSVSDTGRMLQSRARASEKCTDGRAPNQQKIHPFLP
jgi:hypothetical protein